MLYGQCDSSDSPAGSIAFMQRYNVPMQLSNRAHEVKVWEAETFSKCNNTEQLITLIQPQKTVLEVKGCSLDYHPTEHVACCGHQVITCIHVCGGRDGALMTHTLKCSGDMKLTCLWKCWT